MKKRHISRCKKVNKSLDRLFIAIFTLVLLAGLLQTVFFPNDISGLENRYANKMPSLSLSAYMDSSFQAGMEAALGDQVTLSTIYKWLYHEGSSYILLRLCEPFMRMEYFRNHYFSLGSLLVFDSENIVYSPYPTSRQRELDAKAENYNHVFASFPDQDFYLYYIERDTDINFETGEKADFYSYLASRLELPYENIGCFSIDGFEDFRTYFYKTDHHWNHLGSYRGYLDIIGMLGVGEDALVPDNTLKLTDSFSGSKAVSYASHFSEEFKVHSFDFPQMETLINGQPAADYGNQTGPSAQISYSTVYGDDYGEIIFSTSRPDKDDLLIIGESFDNAILKLLASHYNNTYSIDLRYYEPYMGESFVLSEYLKEHPVDKVLLIGNIDYYLLPDFMLA